MCLPYDMVRVKIVRVQFAVLFVVPASQKMLILALDKMNKKIIRKSWNLALATLSTIPKHMFLPSVVIIAQG